MPPMRLRTALAAAPLCLALHVAAPAPLCAQPKPMAPDARKYLQQFIDQLQNRSIYRDRVNWKQLESHTLAAAEGAQSIPELYPAIKVALTELGDRLGRYQPVAGPVIVPDIPRCTAAPFTPPELPKSIGYLRVTPVRNTGMRGLGEAATHLQAQIKTGDQDGAENWIVDLRGMSYGHAAPAVIGLTPLLGEGVAFYIVDTEGGQQPYSIGQQTMKVDGLPVHLAIDRFTLVHKKPRIAVLTDGATASTGELLAVAFSARNDTRSFGVATCGVSPFTSTPIKLKDGATIVLSGTIIADRNRKRYPGAIDPDEKVDDPGQVVERAVRWLTGNP